jgi:thioredoxin-like negative regulator of GroEL
MGRAIAGGALVLVVAAGVVLVVGLLWPIRAQYALTRQAAAAIDAGDLRSAASFASDAARANPRNADAAMLAAKLAPLKRDGAMLSADDWALAATRRDPANSEPWRLLGEVRQRMQLAGVGDVAAAAPADALGQAVALDVANARLRIDYAEALLAVGQPRAALAQADHADRIDAALRAFDPTSHKLLSPTERARLDAIRRSAAQRPAS